jgi:hypothetical protein
MHSPRALSTGRQAVAVIASAWAFISSPAMGQDTSTNMPEPASTTDVIRDAAREASVQSALPKHNLAATNTALILGEAIGLVWYGKRNWWQEGFQGDFRRVDEGWFGQNTYAGGADKLGHFYTNYVGGRLLTQAFRAIGNDPDNALALGAGVALGTMTLVEVADGYSRRWRFSKQDAIMNVLGAGAAILFETHPGLDELVDLRFQYHRSGIEGGRFDPTGDYSGQTYVLALKASGIPGLRDHAWLRYLELAAGYGVRNYSNARPDLVDQRYRQAYVGISLNLSELLRSADPGRRLPGRPVLDTAFEYLQIPGTAVFKRYRLPTN